MPFSASKISEGIVNIKSEINKPDEPFWSFRCQYSSYKELIYGKEPINDLI